MFWMEVIKVDERNITLYNTHAHYINFEVHYIFFYKCNEYYFKVHLHDYLVMYISISFSVI
jgi:hypothetical protein